ncbi:MAG TPA: BTAD domain-containing putative transcriptional regulator [Trebonia sp.]
MRVRLLGPVDVVVGGAVRPVSGLRRKAILATLSLRAGEIVSTDRLADIVWGADPPSTPVNTLQSHVSHLRTVLGSRAAILAKPPGYVLDVGDEGTDARLAERLMRQAARAPDPVQRVRELREALALWRGSPLADLAGIAWLEDQAERLDLLRERIRQALAEARLAAGEHAQLVPELEQMVADHPLNERISGQLMLALYRSGRQADALAAYQRLRATLNEQLGIDPNRTLRDLEMAILRQDASLSLDPAAVRGPQPAAQAPPPPQSYRPAPVPAQLPPPPAGFAGREAEVASLDAMLPALLPAGDADSASVIAAIAGTAGVGKSALALHWAHRIRERFPDGQLYVNLRGFDPHRPAMDPDQALHGFLDAFGVRPERIPRDRDARSGLYRSLLSGKRMLVVLDNARDAEQVRPLLPGSSASLTVVTSRNQLTGLIAAEGARLLGLDLLTVPEAYDLLARRLGASRVAAECQAAEEIIASCARLPLALTIAAARAAARPSFPLAVIAAELRQSASLDPFDGDELAVGLRAVFSCSYRVLSTDAARLFRLLALHPGPEFSVAAAASLLGAPVGQARSLLAELARAHMLAEHSPGRFGCHELLRAYAAEQVRTRDDPGVRDAALRRLLDHFVQTSHAGLGLLDPHLTPFEPTPQLPGVTLGEVAAAGRADDWFAVEYPTLLTAVTAAADTGLATAAWQLAWTLTSFQLRQGYWDDHALAQRAGLDAARRAGDPVGEAHALLALAIGYSRAGHDADAELLYGESLRLFGELHGHLTSQAMIHARLERLLGRKGYLDDALCHGQRALDLHRAAGNRLLEAGSLNDVGYCHALLGNYRQAIAYCELSLAQIMTFGEPGHEAAVWHSLGFIYRRLDSHRRAIDCFERSLELTRARCDRSGEADTLAELGDVYHSAGDAIAAQRAWGRALRIFKEIEHPGAGRIGARMSGAADLLV